MDAWRVVRVFALLCDMLHPIVDISLLGEKRYCDLAIHWLDELDHVDWLLRFVVSIVLQFVFDWDGIPNRVDSMVVLVHPTEASGA